jgi:hypothetical protein
MPSVSHVLSSCPPGVGDGTVERLTPGGRFTLGVGDTEADYSHADDGGRGGPPHGFGGGFRGPLLASANELGGGG